MTTLEFDSIAARLESVGMKFRAARVLHGLALWALVVVPVFAVMVFAAGLVTLPAVVVLGMLAILIAVAVVAYLKTVHGALWQRPTYGQIARWIEENPQAGKLGLNNDLINAVLLSQEAQGGNASGMIPAVIGEIAARTAGVNLEGTVPWGTYMKRMAMAAIMLLAVGIVVGLFPGAFGHGLKVLAHPLATVPREGSSRIVTVDPGNDTLLAGQSVNFAVTVASPGNKVVDAVLVMTLQKSGKTLTVPMSPFGNENTQYRYILAAAAEDIDYHVAVGSGRDVTESQTYHISVVPEIHLTKFSVQISPPAYTGKEAQTIAIEGKDLSSARGTIEVPQGSIVNVSAVLDGPARGMVMDVMGAQPVSLEMGEDHAYHAALVMRETVRYALLINDGQGRTLKRYPEDAGSSTSLALVAVMDAPPTVPQVTEPGRDMDAKPGQTVQFAATMTDDIGLTAVRLEIAHTKAGAKNAGEVWETAKAWTVGNGKDGKPVQGVSVKHAMVLDAAAYALGDTIKFRFVAEDNRNLPKLGENGTDLGHQVTVGEVFAINLNDTAAAALKSSQLWDDLRKRIQAILEKQVALRDTVRIAKPKDVTEAKAIAKKVGTGQTGVRLDIDTLAKTFPFESKMKLIQKTLEVLVLEDATNAVDRSGDLSLVSDLKSAPALAGKLLESQNRIIDVLETLLAITTNEEEKAKQIASHTGGDLPGNPDEMWKKLEEKLKEFEKQQKEVIKASADLAKKPKDQWDKNDDAKAKELAAIEDKWEKFLNQQLLDMSKLAEQDQANATILEEMVQMKVELAMAKDALTNKATEIATPMEENGLEDAKALDTHIERWLQQQPDRTKWQMEDALAQNEPPMAELPKQLQDMMGDLMDQQEDLTQDMESTAGKFADSINKGAGWDAADGPISNMSAQGVTGNQMPKDMEIQGRSGDGREGRSSGEMVGATAEDKGGRQTPTRMTNEPFSAGQVDDKAQQPAGGATGGGKKGGVGGEGLEGNAPDKTGNEPTQRMAQKQAQLRNEAERLALTMHAAGYSQEKLFEAVTLMQKAEESIKANRYDNAVNYQKLAAEAMNSAKLLASGQMHVTLDTTPQASAKVQKDMQDAMNGSMPKGYADPVKAYFERLSQPGN